MVKASDIINRALKKMIDSDSTSEDLDKGYYQSRPVSLGEALEIGKSPKKKKSK